LSLSVARLIEFLEKAPIILLRIEISMNWWTVLPRFSPWLPANVNFTASSYQQILPSYWCPTSCCDLPSKFLFGHRPRGFKAGSMVNGAAFEIILLPDTGRIVRQVESF
jgi:hypothetical protein